MNKEVLIRELQASQLRSDHPYFQVGDTIAVHFRIKDGDKERTQVIEGIVVGRQGGGLTERITLYRIAHNSGSTRQFFIHSPLIAKIILKREGVVRRAKLNYIIGQYGKKARVKMPKGGSRQKKK